jgi:hypothetical protein
MPTRNQEHGRSIRDECRPGSRAWKGLDWGVMNLLYERGWILDPHGKARSVVLTDTGLELAEKLLLEHFRRGS